MKKKRIIGMLLSLVIVLGLMLGMSLTAYANQQDPVKYLDDQGKEQSCINYIELTSNSESTLKGGWYVVKNDATISDANGLRLGTVKNAIAGTGWTNTVGTEGETVIPISSSGQTLTYKRAQFLEVKKDIIYTAKDAATYDGKAHGIDVYVIDPASGATVKYGKTDGNYDLDASPTITDVKDSPLTVYFKITADGYNDLTGRVVLTISKANSVVTKAPTAKNLTCNGKKQKLVEAGVATGGTMQYALGTSAAATETYTDDIPEKSDAGT